MRAREPELSGFIDHDGVKIAWDVYGDGDVTLLLLPTWTIVHSRFWKGQIAYLARHCRVVTFDGPGNGRSDRPLDPAPYGVTSMTAMALRSWMPPGPSAPWCCRCRRRRTGRFH